MDKLLFRVGFFVLDVFILLTSILIIPLVVIDYIIKKLDNGKIHKSLTSINLYDIN